MCRVWLLQPTPWSVPPVKWCRRLQACAWASALALVYLLVQRCWSVFSVKWGPRYSAYLLAVVAGCSFAGCSWLMSCWSCQPTLQHDCFPGLGAEGSQHCPLAESSMWTAHYSCPSSLLLRAAFLATASLQGDSGSGVPRTPFCTYKITMHLGYYAYAVCEKLI